MSDTSVSETWFFLDFLTKKKKKNLPCGYSCNNFYPKFEEFLLRPRHKNVGKFSQVKPTTQKQQLPEILKADGKYYVYM